MSGYRGHRKVPRRIHIIGDIDLGKKLIGEADSQLRILEQQMNFQNLKQGVRTFKPNPNVVIECWSCFSVQGVRIIAGMGGEVDPTTIKWDECFCSCHIAQGIITGAFLEPCTFDFMETTHAYDVELCNGSNNKYSYVAGENIPAVGFAPIEVGQFVIMVWSTGNDPLYSETKNNICSMAIGDTVFILDVPPIGAHTKQYKKYSKVVE